MRLANEEHNNHEEGNAPPKKKTAENGKAGPVVGADLDPERFRTLEVVEMKETMKKVMLDWQKEFG